MMNSVSAAMKKSGSAAKKKSVSAARKKSRSVCRKRNSGSVRPRKRNADGRSALNAGRWQSGKRKRRNAPAST